MSNFISSKRSFGPIIIVSALLLVGSIWTWYGKVYMRPAAVFERMLMTSFATNGVSKETSQSGDGQKVIQKTQVVTTPVARTHATNSQHISDSGIESDLATESIGSESADFIRYTNLKTSQKTADGKNLDFSSVLNKWGKADANSGGVQLYNSAVLGIMPIGNLSGTQRKAILSQIKQDHVYKIDYTKVTKGKAGARPVYSYDVSIKPDAYVAMLKRFGQDVGLRNEQLARANPAQYKDSPPLKFQFDIDAWSGQLKTVTYKDSSKRSENYFAYGARLNIDIPTSYVSVDDLQSKLQEIR